MHLTLPDFESIRALVVGDVMLDQYWDGTSERISPEAPVPIVAVEDERFHIGGAGNVAVNLTALGAHAALLASIGPDQPGRSLSRLLKQHKIENRMIVQKDTQTPRKLRVVSQHQQLLRLDFEKKIRFDKTVFERTYRSALNHSNVVILSDYGKGTLPSPANLSKIAQRRGIPTFVDPKRDDFEAYAGATAITPNRKELEAVTGPLEDLKAIAKQARRLCKKHRFKAMLVTLGEQGMLLQHGNSTQHLGTSARDVFDVTGAGDTVISTFAAAWAAGQSPEDSMRLASLAAGEVVGKFGTAAVTPSELVRAARSERTLETGIVSQHALRRLTREVTEALGVELGATSEDLGVSLEAVYCLGLCASGPCATVDERVVVRVTREELLR